MKITQKLKNLFIPIILGVSLMSCLNDSDQAPIEPFANISIYHGAPETSSLDVFANSNRVTNNPFQFTETLPYLRYYLGERTFKFSPYNSVSSLLEKTFTIEDNKVYSMFFTGLPNNLDAFLIEDQWGELSRNQAQVRFVHVAPGTNAVEIQLDANEENILDDLDFKTSSEFEAVDAKSYNIQVKSKDSGEVLLIANNVELRGNRVYTFILRGLQEEDIDVNKKLNLQLVTNFINY